MSMRTQHRVRERKTETGRDTCVCVCMCVDGWDGACERQHAIDSGRYIISDRWVISYQMGFIKISSAAAAADCVPSASSSIRCLLCIRLCSFVSMSPSLSFSVSLLLFFQVLSSSSFALSLLFLCLRLRSTCIFLLYTSVWLPVCICLWVSLSIFLLPNHQTSPPSTSYSTPPTS